MLDQLVAFDGSTDGLSRLAENVRGLLVAADLHDRALIDGFWENFQEVDMELELRTEPWAPSGSPNDQRLHAGIATFRSWVQSVLDSAGPDRE